MIHNVKTWPDHYREMISGHKTAEMRKLDRPYSTGDVLVLEEYNPTQKKYTGRSAYFQITHILTGEVYGILDGYGMISVKPMHSRPVEHIPEEPAMFHMEHLKGSGRITGVIHVFPAEGQDLDVREIMYKNPARFKRLVQTGRIIVAKEEISEGEC